VEHFVIIDTNTGRVQMPFEHGRGGVHFFSVPTKTEKATIAVVNHFKDVNLSDLSALEFAKKVIEVVQKVSPSRKG